MSIVSMTDAASGAIASSSEYNKLIDNIVDLDTRLGQPDGSSAGTRLTTLETRTTDTATNGGHGNVRLSDRFGTGVGTGSNVTTGSASSQLADLRSRATTLEGQVGAAPSSPTLHSRVATLEAASTVTPLVRATRFSAAAVNTTTNAYTYIPWTAAPRNPNTMWSNTNQTRLTVPAGQGGLYEVASMILILPSTTNAANTSKAIGIRTNGAGAIARAGSPWLGVSGNYTEALVQMYMELNAGDYIEIGVWHNYGTPSEITIGSDAGAPWVVMRKVAS